MRQLTSLYFGYFIERVLAVFLLVLLSPLFVLTALSIFFSSGLPIFFSQPRVGYMRSLFVMLKFRTMYKGAEEDQKNLLLFNEAQYPIFKLKRDPRFVGIGYWLARTGFDELPQLINIIRGEMGFVGPRPLPVNEENKLGKSWMFRYQIKPGVFSDWTASRDRHKSLQLWKDLDKQTVSNRTINYQISLIFKTINLVWFGKKI